MPENNAVSGSSDSAADNLQESMRGLNIQDNHGGTQDNRTNHRDSDNNSNPTPDRPAVPDCIYYLKHGVCGYGAGCRYNHPSYVGQEQLSQGDLPERGGQPDCQHFLKTGTCKYGYTCKYNHPKTSSDDGQMSFNSLGLPIRQEEKSCPYYMRTGYCKFGTACKFNHPQPTTISAVPPLSGSPSYASVGSSMVSPSGMPLVGGIPSWSVPRPYTTTHMNGFPSYMPFVLPSSQGFFPQQGWSTYTSAISPASSSDTLGSSHVNNSNHMPFVSSTHVLFPERPDQPDCQYYMKNGSCKYGSSCKYHHPRDRINLATACTIGPLGLPLRPGQAICTSYSTYGTCRYGLGCKYDHPLAGYFNYAIPAFPFADPSAPFAYQRSAQVIWTPPDAVNSKTSKLSDSLIKSEAANNVEIVNTSLAEDGLPHASSTTDTPSRTLHDQSD